MRLSLLVTTVAATLITTATLTGCGSPDENSGGKLHVVASTNVWASVTTAIAGDTADVSALIKDPSADPHSFETTPTDAASVLDADLVVYNGGGYDGFMTKILAGHSDKPAVDAFAEHATLPNRADTNEHIWYDMPTVSAVANSIADKLSTLRPGDAGKYKDNLAKFRSQLDEITALTTATAKTHPDAPIAQTEPVAHYLVVASGAKDLTPPEFEEAMENGSDPSPQAVAETRDLISQHKVKALLFNTQTEGKAATDVRDLANSNHVPVVDVTETLPANTDFITWQKNSATALANALNQ